MNVDSVIIRHSPIILLYRMFKRYKEYLQDNPNHYWFKRKLYGWGWVPVKWQGWIVILVYLAILLTLGFAIDESSPPQEVAIAFLLPLLLATFVLIGMCYAKGEKPRWQWGIPKK